MLVAPAQYANVPLADTAKPAPKPTVSIRSATRIGSPVSVEAVQIEPLGHEGAVPHEKEEVWRSEAIVETSSDTRLRSGESSDAT